METAPHKPRWTELLAAHPHDSYFKWVFSETSRAARFFQTFLPAELVAVVDWSTLRLEASTEIDDRSLAPACMDLFFAVGWDQRAIESGAIDPETVEKDLRLYLIFEHQSTPEEGMVFRLLRYMVLAMRRHERQFGFPLMPVVPVLLHQGEREWPAPHGLDALVAYSKALRELLHGYILRFNYHLVDLATIDPEALPDRMLQLVLMAMRAVGRKRVREFLIWLAEQTDAEWDADLASTTVGYGLKTAVDVDGAEAMRILVGAGNMSSTITAFDQIVAMGSERRMELGKELIMERGILLGKLCILEKLASKVTLNPSDFQHLSDNQLKARIAELEAQVELQS
jgi:hypothetical protein